MIELDIQLPQAASSQVIERVIEDQCAAAGLRVTLKSTLARHAGCIHWHLKKGRASGTLEITLLADGSRAWFKIQAARSADWVHEVVEALQERIELQLAAAPAEPTQS